MIGSELDFFPGQPGSIQRRILVAALPWLLLSRWAARSTKTPPSLVRLRASLRVEGEQDAQYPAMAAVLHWSVQVPEDVFVTATSILQGVG